MSQKEILEKAIQKAIDGGWRNDYWVDRYTLAVRLDELEYLFNYETPSVESVIFNHDFAKALWGEGHVTCVYYSNETGSTVASELNMWQYHLQQMVIAEDPIKYLGENI